MATYVKTIVRIVAICTTRNETKKGKTGRSEFDINADEKDAELPFIFILWRYEKERGGRGGCIVISTNKTTHMKATRSLCPITIRGTVI